jgi:hypothetical protein
VTAGPKRINISLDAEQAAKLTLMAERSHLQEGTLARSLLCVAIDAADPSSAHVHMLLDSIPGALERAEAGSREIRAGEGVPLEDL